MGARKSVVLLALAACTLQAASQSQAQTSEPCGVPLDPQAPATDALFHSRRPGLFGQLRFRDLEFQWSDDYSPGGLTSTDIQTLDNLGNSIAGLTGRNPFGAPYPDIQLIHDYFHKSLVGDPERRYNDGTSPSDSIGFLIGGYYTAAADSIKDRGHADHYIFTQAQPGNNTTPASWCTHNEDVSTGRSGWTCDQLRAAGWHANSIQAKGPHFQFAADPNGTGWAHPDSHYTTVFNHEFQHALPLTTLGAMDEFFSTAAEAVGGIGRLHLEPRVDIPFTWGLLSFGSTAGCENVELAGKNYSGWRYFSAYLAYNFRGADTTVTIPAVGAASGFGDDLLWKWARTGRRLIDLQNLLDNTNCWNCAQKSYFQGLLPYDRLQLLHHNWRVANYANNAFLQEGQYGYPSHHGFSPGIAEGAWQDNDGCVPSDDAVAIPPEVTAHAAWATRETTMVGRRYQVFGGQQYSYPMELQPFGSEYWVVRSHPSIVDSQTLVVRVTAEDIYRVNCGGTQRDGRVFASVVAYTDQPADLWDHPELAIYASPVQWADVDSVARELVFEVPDFGSTYKAAVVVISLGDGPSQWHTEQYSIPYTRALNYRLSLSLAKAPYPAPFASPIQNPLALAQIGGSDGTTQLSPTWSPLGNEVAYVWDRRPFYPFSVVVRQSVTDSARVVVSGYAGDQWDPDWSPRGDWIAFVQDSAGASHPWIKNLSTGELRQLVRGNVRVVTPVFEPNGQRLAFAWQALPASPISHSGWSIRRVNLDGAGLTTLVATPPGEAADDGRLSSVRWSPMGDFVYCVRNDSLLAVPSSGGSLAYRGSVVAGRRVTSFDLPINNGPIVLEEPGQATSGGQCPVDYRRITFADTTKSPVDIQQRFYRTGADFGTPRWALDGVRIAYSSTQNEGNAHDILVGMASYNHAPVFNAGVADKIVTPGQPFSMSLAATDSDNDPLTYVGYYLPAGSSISGSTFSWPSPQVSCSDSYVVFRALDPGGGAAHKVVKLSLRPAAVVNLSVATGKNTAVLNWTEPSQGGCNADKYDIRRWTSPITETNFYSATFLDSSVAPGPPGTQHCFEVSGLSACTPYYFAIKTKGRGLWSWVSNVPSGTTECTGSQVFCSEGLMAGGGGGGESAPSSSLLPESAGDETSEFVTASWENSLLWGTQDAQASDLYKLAAMANPSDGTYRLNVWAAGGRQAELDELSLGIVDHDPTLAAVAGGDSVYLGVLGSIASAMDAKGQDIANLGEPLAFEAGQEIVIGLAGNAPGTALVVESTGTPGAKDSLGILVQQQQEDSSWTTIATIHPRRNADSYAVRTGGGGTVRLVFLRQCVLRSVGQLAVMEATIPQRLQLTQADHSRLGAVSGAISAKEGEVATLLPGDAVSLAFAASDLDPSRARGVFLVAHGAFQPVAEDASGQLGTSGSQASDAAGPAWEFALGAARPNPTSGEVSINYTLARESNVTLRIYNVAGRLVRDLVGERQKAGPHDTIWNLRDNSGVRVSSGVYFYRLVAEEWSSQKKVVFLER